MSDINVTFEEQQINVQFPNTPTEVIYWGDILGTLADQADLSAALWLRMLKSANLSDVANVATARSNLWLGSLATQNSNSVNITWWSITWMSTPVLDSDVATKGYTDSILAANDAMVFKWVIDCSTNPNYPAASAGHTYKISVAGKIWGASWLDVEVWDTIYCITDWSAAWTQAAVWANWVIVQSNIDTTTIVLRANNLSDLTNTTTARANLGLTIGTHVQAQNANLSAIAWLTSDADKVAYFTWAGAAALADFTSFGRSIVAAANAAAVWVLLWLVIWSTVQAYDANTTILGNSTTGTGAIVRETSATLITPNIWAATATSITASWSWWFLIESNSWTDIVNFGAWWGSNATFYGGVSLSTFTEWSVLFAGSWGLISQDNATLFFDNTNNRLWLLTTAPTHTLTLWSTSTGIAVYNTADQTTNLERMVWSWSSNVYSFNTNCSGTGTGRALRISATSSAWTNVAFLQVHRQSAPYIQAWLSGAAPTGDWQVIFNVTGGIAWTSGTLYGMSVTNTINQSWTAWFTALLINTALTAQGSWLQLLQDWQAGSTSLAVMTSAGFLGLKTTAPTHSITLGSTATWIALYNTADQTTNYERVRALRVSNVYTIVFGRWWSWSWRVIKIGANSSWDSDTPPTFIQVWADNIYYTLRSGTSASLWHIMALWANTASSWTLNFLAINWTVNHTGTAWRTILDLNPGITAEWSWSKNFILCRKASWTTLFWIDSNGVMYFDRTYTAAGTTATQTINKPSWSVNAVAWATSVTVNNSLVTTSSLVYPVLLTNDTTAEIKNVVVSAGSFVINFVAAVTAETKVWRFVVNT